MRTQIKHLTCLLLGLLGFKALPAQALDMYLCIDGIPGEVTDTQSQKHAGCIDVLAWSWGMSNSNANIPGGGGGGGKANIQDISVTKWLDRASPLLGSELTGGKGLGPIALYVEKSCGTGCETPYYKLEIPIGSFVTSQSQGGSDGEGQLTENVSFNIPAVKWCYSYDADGTGPKAPEEICRGWSVVENVPYP
jgi:type VI secretion system secreted protein Hcp